MKWYELVQVSQQKGRTRAFQVRKKLRMIAQVQEESYIVEQKCRLRVITHLHFIV